MSKNNRDEFLRKMTPQRQRFGLRKLTVGVASVLLGTTFLVGGTIAHADDGGVNTQSSTVQSVISNSSAPSTSAASSQSNSGAVQSAASSASQQAASQAGQANGSQTPQSQALNAASESAQQVPAKPASTSANNSAAPASDANFQTLNLNSNAATPVSNGLLRSLGAEENQEYMVDIELTDENYKALTIDDSTANNRALKRFYAANGSYSFWTSNPEQYINDITNINGWTLTDQSRQDLANCTTLSKHSDGSWYATGDVRLSLHYTPTPGYVNVWAQRVKLVDQDGNPLKLSASDQSTYLGNAYNTSTGEYYAIAQGGNYAGDFVDFDGYDLTADGYKTLQENYDIKGNGHYSYAKLDHAVDITLTYEKAQTQHTVKIKLVNALTGEPIKDTSNPNDDFAKSEYDPSTGVFTYTGDVGSEIDTDLVNFYNIPGYVVDSDPSDFLPVDSDNYYTVPKYDLDNVTIKYLPLSPVEVQYVDTEGHLLLQTDYPATGVVADNGSGAIESSKYAFTGLDIPGYQLVSEPTVTGNWGQTQTADSTNPIIVKFTYKLVDKNKARFVDFHTWGLSHGPLGDYKTPVNDDGAYTADWNDASTSSEDTKRGLNLNGAHNAYQTGDYENPMTYAPLDYVANQPVTVRYYDEDGNEIAPAETLATNPNWQSSWGDFKEDASGRYEWAPSGTWTATAKSIAGYTYVRTDGLSDQESGRDGSVYTSSGSATTSPVDGNSVDSTTDQTVTGTYNPFTQVVTFVYAKNPDTYTWTVKYQAEDGTKIHADALVGGNYSTGSHYDIAQDSTNYLTNIDYNGQHYILVPKLAENESGTFANGNQVTTLVYKLDEGTPFPSTDDVQTTEYPTKTLTRTVNFVVSQTYSGSGSYSPVKDENGNPVPAYQEQYQITPVEYDDQTTGKRLIKYTVKNVTTGKTSTYTTTSRTDPVTVLYDAVTPANVKGWIPGRLRDASRSSDIYQYSATTLSVGYWSWGPSALTDKQYIPYDYDDSAVKPGDKVTDDHIRQNQVDIFATDTDEKFYRNFYYDLSDDNNSGKNLGYDDNNQHYAGTQMLEFTRTKTVDSNGNVTYGKWVLKGTDSTTGTFPAFKYPHIAGYYGGGNVNYENALAVTIDPNTQRVPAMVVFYPYLALYKVKIVDDTTGETLNTFDNQTVPLYDQDGSINEQDKAAQLKDNVYHLIDTYKKTGYAVVSDDYQGNVSYDLASDAKRSEGSTDDARYTYSIHLVHKAVLGDPQTVTRTIHYVPINGIYEKKLQDDTVQSITYKATYYLDATNHSGKVVNVKTVKDVDGNTVTVVDPKNTTTPKKTWSEDLTASTNKDVSEDGKTFNAINTPKVITLSPAEAAARGVNSGKWILVSGYNHGSAAIPEADKIPADDVLLDGYLAYQQEATRHDESRTLTRTIHYVPADDHGKRLADDTTQSVAFTGTYFTDADGKQVNAKLFKDADGNAVKDADGQDIWLIDYSNTATPKETWTVDTSAANKGLSTDNKDFVAVTTPQTITLDAKSAAARKVNSGYWNYVDGANQAALFNADGTPVAKLADGYVEYSQDDAAQTKTVNEIIHYVKTDGTKAADDYTATALTFSRTGTKDKDGHTIWGAWTADQNFAAQDSPAVTGYMPDLATVPAINVTVGTADAGLTGTATSVTVNGDSTDPATVVRTVTYTANDQTAKITYIDDTTGEALKTDNAGGKYDTAIDFPTSPSDRITAYEKQGYELVSNSFDNQKYSNDNSRNVFEVHLKHGTEAVSRSKTVDETIHYVYSDNSTAHPDVNGTALTFTQTGTKDKVTGTTDWDGTWTADQQFAAVTSPVITGYTPDKASVPTITVTVGDADSGLTTDTAAVTVNGNNTDPATVVRTVTYTANDQTAKITYIDDTTGKTLKINNAGGKYNTAIDFPTSPSDQIATYEDQGYELVSNNFDNQKYSNDNSKNVFEVHLKHGTTTVSRDKDVTQTIHYRYSDGTTAQPDNVQTLHFTETGTKDLVTGKVTYTPAASQSYTAVTSPTIAGYTPDKASVPTSTADFDSQDTTIMVTYTANDQAAGIKYIDDTTGETLKTDSAKGKYGTAISFPTDPATQINTYEGAGYVLVSNDFSGQTYQTDNAKNQFVVHLKHGTTAISRDKDVTQTIHYRYSDGTTAQPDNVQTLHFTETGVHDNVTGTDTWTPAASQNYMTVTTPTITGYTPDKTSVPGSSVNYGSGNTEITVAYNTTSQPTQPTNASQPTSVTTPTQPTNASQPTSVTTPTQPTNASQPTSVTTPTQPTNASQPTSVTTPTQPTNASQPTSVTSPTQPTNASQPTSVTSPTQPTNASQPTSVTTPTQPTNASQPTSVTSPTQPTNASQPTSVTTPTQPTNASQPTSVTTPTQPTNVSQPTSVTTPTQPTNASQPTSVTTPTQPTNASQPTSVTTPTQPTNASQPTSVTTPTQPTNASQPTNVTTPTQPTNASQPTTASQPTQTSSQQPTSPAQPMQPVQNSGAGSNTSVAVPRAASRQGRPASQSTATQKKLPQTGNRRASGALALGLSSLALLFGFAGKKRKRD